jgi:prephenate dehydrogenase
LIPLSFRKFSSNSLKDLTRISFSPASVWADIFLSNKKNLIKDIEKFIKILNKFKNLIKNEDRENIFKLIEEINAKYNTFWKKR